MRARELILIGVLLLCGPVWGNPPQQPSRYSRQKDLLQQVSEDQSFHDLSYSDKVLYLQQVVIPKGLGQKFEAMGPGEQQRFIKEAVLPELGYPEPWIDKTLNQVIIVSAIILLIFLASSFWYLREHSHLGRVIRFLKWSGISVGALLLLWALVSLLGSDDFRDWLSYFPAIHAFFLVATVLLIVFAIPMWRRLGKGD